MASPRKFLGKVPFARALLFTARREHVTRHSVEKPPGFLKVPPKLVSDIQAKIEHYDAANRSHVNLESWRRMLELAQEMSKYVGRRPTYSQAVAAVVLSKGLEHPQLKSYAEALHSLNRRAVKNGKPLFSDWNPGVLSAFANHSIAEVDRALAANPACTVTRLAQTTLIPRNRVEKSLRILKEIPLAVQLPAEQGKTGDKSYRWISIEHRLSPETKPFSNYAWKILQSLAQAPKKLSELSGYSTPRRKFGTGELDPRNTTITLGNLERIGALSSKLTTSGGLPARVYSLSEQTQGLVEEQNQRASITPPIRRILLGKPLVGLHASEQRNLEKFVLVIRLRQAHQPAKKGKGTKAGTLKKLAEGFGITRDAVIRAIYRKPPWGRIPYEVISGIYLPAMRKLYPNQAAWFESHLKQNKDSLKSTHWPVRKYRAQITPLDLFEQHTGLAQYLARREWERNSSLYKSAARDYSDLKQTALMALNRASEAYSPKKGRLFSTVAGSYIKRYFRNFYRKAKNEARIRTFPLIENDTRASTKIGEQIEIALRKELLSALKAAINNLNATQRNKQILRDAYGLETGRELTNAELAEKYGITAGQIWSIRKEMLEQLRQDDALQKFKDNIA